MRARVRTTGSLKRVLAWFQAERMAAMRRIPRGQAFRQLFHPRRDDGRGLATLDPSSAAP